MDVSVLVVDRLALSRDVFYLALTEGRIAVSAVPPAVVLAPGSLLNAGALASFCSVCSNPGSATRGQDVPYNPSRGSHVRFAPFPGGISRGKSRCVHLRKADLRPHNHQLPLRPFNATR
jgi:hypothetical protein